MSKSIDLSRNKKIKYYHQATGETYKDCRSKLKACNWDLGLALNIHNLPIALDSFNQMLEPFVETFNRIIIATVEATVAAGEAFAKTFSEVLNDD